MRRSMKCSRISVSFDGCGKAARKLMPRKWKNDINC